MKDKSIKSYYTDTKFRDNVDSGADNNVGNEVENELQAFSRGLTHLIFRNLRIVEEIHAKQMALDDEVMKTMNIEISNRIYALLSIWLYGSDEEIKELFNTIEFNSFYGRGSWESARKVEL